MHDVLEPVGLHSGDDIFGNRMSNSTDIRLMQQPRNYAEIKGFHPELVAVGECIVYSGCTVGLISATYLGAASEHLKVCGGWVQGGYSLTPHLHPACRAVV